MKGRKKGRKKEGKGGLDGSRWLPQAVGELWDSAHAPTLLSHARAELSRCRERTSWEKTEPSSEISLNLALFVVLFHFYQTNAWNHIFFRIML